MQLKERSLVDYLVSKITTFFPKDMEQVVTTQSSSMDNVSKRMEQAVTTSSQENLQTLSQDKIANVLTEGTPLLLQDSKNKPADIVQTSLTSSNVTDVFNNYIKQWQVYSQDQQLLLSLILENSNIILQKLQDVNLLKSQVDSIFQQIQSKSLPVQSSNEPASNLSLQSNALPVQSNIQNQQKTLEVQSNHVPVHSIQAQSRSVEANDVQTWFQKSSVSINDQDSNPHSQTQVRNTQSQSSNVQTEVVNHANENRTLKIFPAQPYIVGKSADDRVINDRKFHEKQSNTLGIENKDEIQSKPYVIHQATIDEIDGNKKSSNSKSVISRPGEIQPLKIISASQDSNYSHQQEPSGMQQQHGYYENDSSYYNRGTSQYYHPSSYSKGYGKGQTGYGNGPYRRYKRTTYKAGYGQRSNYYQDGSNDYAEDDLYEDEDDDYDDNNNDDLQQDLRIVQQLKRGRMSSQQHQQQSLPPAKYPRYV